LLRYRVHSAESCRFLHHSSAAGIYTSNSQWSPITGGSTQLSKYPLWYPHYDNNPSFSDFVPFGGWSKPAIKQYAGTTSFCGASVDLNYY
jgi:GH25 family lysozyme M1 (1,4-beta-N-acetylmuramidase)